METACQARDELTGGLDNNDVSLPEIRRFLRGRLRSSSRRVPVAAGRRPEGRRPLRSPSPTPWPLKASTPTPRPLPSIVSGSSLRRRLHRRRRRHRLHLPAKSVTRTC